MFIHNNIFCQDHYILYICDATNDSEFTKILQDAGYNVIRIENEYSGILNQEELDYANNAALIIMSRNCFSGDYGGTEALASQWNSIRTPLITFSVFITRNTRWQWFNSENVLCEGDHAIKVPASASEHSIYKGIGTLGTFDIYNGIAPDLLLDADILGNGKVLAYNSDESGILIAEWSAGIPFYEGTGQIPASKRIFFAAGESDCGPSEGQNMSAYNLNATGKKIFLNMVRYLMLDATFCKFQNGCVPVIDGIKDPVWDFTEAHKINRYYKDEYPSLNLATWRAAWNDTSIFILVTVNDNDFCPDWESGDEQWMSDKVEIYFDVNDFLGDGGGPVNRNGHYQIAPWFYDGAYEYFSSGYQWSGPGVADVYATVAYKVNDPDYVYEYAINIQDLRNENGVSLNPYNVDMIGFDVTIVDRDDDNAGRKRAVWRNTGEIDESWANMNDCGNVKFSAKPVTEFPKPEIRLKGRDILICLDSGRNSYAWYYENNRLEDETKQFCRISSGFAGNYFVTIDNEYGCKIKSNPFYLAAKSGTLKNSEPVIEIYPVPNTGDFRLGMSGDQSGRITINIRDFSGKIIKTLLIDKSTEPVSEEIRLFNVPKGVYMLDILFNNEIYIKRILIN
jgi:hypothetical protein